jgi:hypothetical protein
MTICDSFSSYFALVQYPGLKALYAVGRGKRQPDISWWWNKFGYGFYVIQSLQSSEPRDRVYAFLWILRDGPAMRSPVLTVDYSKPVELLFTELMTALIRRTETFRLLDLAL